MASASSKIKVYRTMKSESNFFNAFKIPLIHNTLLDNSMELRYSISQIVIGIVSGFSNGIIYCCSDWVD